MRSFLPLSLPVRRGLVCAALVPMLAFGCTQAVGSDPPSGGGSGGHGGAGTGGAGTGGAGTGGTSGSCGPNTAKLAGSLDGTPIDATYSSQRVSSTSSISGLLGTGGEISVKISYKCSGQAPCFSSAELTMPEEGPLAGKTFCTTTGTFEALRPADGSNCPGACGFAFTLRSLRLKDASNTNGCTGVDISGEIQGCVGEDP